MTNRSPAQAIPVFLAFLAMGFADAAGPFVGLAKQQFHLSNFAAQLIAAYERDPKQLQLPKLAEPPPGQPIGEDFEPSPF